MKSTLLIFFILFSLGSSLFEQVEASICSDEVMSVYNDHSCFTNFSTHNTTHSRSETSCHDSNCFGSAHFGHGYYYSPELVINALPQNLIFRNVSLFAVEQFISTVHLEGPFRPPLS